MLAVPELAVACSCAINRYCQCYHVEVSRVLTSICVTGYRLQDISRIDGLV